MADPKPTTQGDTANGVLTLRFLAKKETKNWTIFILEHGNGFLYAHFASVMLQMGTVKEDANRMTVTFPAELALTVKPVEFCQGLSMMYAKPLSVIM